MRKGIKIIFLLCIAFSLCLTGETESFGQQLKREAAAVDDIKGVYNLILYGSRYLSDVETIAILDREGDGYTLEPYAPEDAYKMMKGVSAQEAIEEAKIFVSWHNAYLKTEISRITDKEGVTFGYEFRPLYQPLTFGLVDVLDVRYSIDEGRVVVHISLKPSVDNQLFHGGDGSTWGN